MKFKLAAFADEAGSSIGEQISAMKENDVAYLEIRGVNGENISDLTIEKARDIRKQLEDSGISVWSLGSPYGKIGIEEDFIPHLDKFKHGLELADILGAKHIRLFSFYIPQGSVEKYKDEVMLRLDKFISAASGSGIILCHENEKDIYGDNALRCEEIHKEFPELKAVFDPANFIQCGQDTKAAWELLNPYVEYMHIKDARSDGAVVPAGKGEGNISFLLSQYKGEILTIEPHLAVFEGFDELEAGEKTSIGEYCYPSSRAAFDAAVNALKDLIK